MLLELLLRTDQAQRGFRTASDNFYLSSTTTTAKVDTRNSAWSTTKNKGLDGGSPITEAIVTRMGGAVPPERGKRGTAPRAQHVERGPSAARETPETFGE